MSSAKPRLLFFIAKDNVESFFSLRQLQNTYHEKSSSTDLVVAAEFHVKFPSDKMRIRHLPNRQFFSYGYASGLIYFYGASCNNLPLICNPNTGRYATLPFLKRYRKTYSFFMFEPIDKQYKVLFMAYPYGPGHHKIITLGTGDMKWRTIKCSWRHNIVSEGICINGVFYYIGEEWDYDDGHDDFIIVCFDVRSEKFTFINVETFCEPINYKGKLAVIYWEDNAINELHVWVLEDIEKPEWSKYAYDEFDVDYLFLAGATASGEIVFSMRKYSPEEPFYVFYFNPERNNLRRVEIQGFAKSPCSVYTFVDHVEDLNVNVPKLLKSFHTPSVKPLQYESFTDSDLDSESESE